MQPQAFEQPRELCAGEAGEMLAELPYWGTLLTEWNYCIGGGSGGPAPRGDGVGRRSGNPPRLRRCGSAAAPLDRQVLVPYQPRGTIQPT
jgi:hypothetical protein